MKKVYSAPQLIVHGSVEEITQAFGPSPQKDTVFIGGSNVQGSITSTGSVDGVIVPK
jgi:hypothetical protein